MINGADRPRRRLDVSGLRSCAIHGMLRLLFQPPDHVGDVFEGMFLGGGGFESCWIYLVRLQFF
jgi:hypothetical protein